MIVPMSVGYLEIETKTTTKYLEVINLVVKSKMSRQVVDASFARFIGNVGVFFPSGVGC